MKWSGAVLARSLVSLVQCPNPRSLPSACLAFTSAWDPARQLECGDKHLAQDLVLSWEPLGWKSTPYEPGGIGMLRYRYSDLKDE